MRGPYNEGPDSVSQHVPMRPPPTQGAPSLTQPSDRVIGMLNTMQEQLSMQNKAYQQLKQQLDGFFKQYTGQV